MKAVKIRKQTRVLLYDPQRPKSRRYLLKRWGGRLPDGGVLTAEGALAAGSCGHYSFWKLRILLHGHRGDRPVPSDMRAALRGEAPVPAWFRGGGQ